MVKKKKILVTLAAACLAMGISLTDDTHVMTVEAESAVQTVVSQTAEGSMVISYERQESAIADLEVIASDGEAVQLETPQNLMWGENWNMCFDGVPEAEGYYEIEVYKDGEKCFAVSWGGLTGDTVTASFSDEMEESGVYKFRVKAKADYDDEGLLDSEWSEFSEERTYVRPKKALAKPEVWWDDTKVGIVHYKTVGNAGGYEIVVYQVIDGEARRISGSWSVSDGYQDTAGEERISNVSSNFRAGGIYYVTVRALSGDVDTIANGEESEPTELFDTTKSAQAVGQVFSDAMENAAASDALKQITDSLDTSAINNAMQTSEDVLNQVSALEALYTAEKGIAVAAPVVSEEAEQYVDASLVSVVGAGLNTESDNIGLEIHVPDNKEYVSDQHYKNSVQLDISLVSDGSAIHGDLTMPITITMPIPEGLAAKYLVILHYDANGVAVKESLRINDDNTVTFTVSSLSTFAFAEGTPFSDVKLTDWCYKYALFAYENQLMGGKGTTEDGLVIFDPASNMTRAEFVQSLYSKEGKPEVSYQAIFADVTEDDWFADAVIWANQNGIVAGGGGIFNVYGQITRQEMAAILHKYAVYKGYDAETDAELTGFADADSITEWAIPGMKWAISHNVIGGNTRKELNPLGQAIRAEAATMLRAFMVELEGAEAE